MQHEPNPIKSQLLQAIAELPNWDQAASHLKNDDAREVFSAFRTFYKRDIIEAKFEIVTPANAIKGLASLLFNEEWLAENDTSQAELLTHIEKAADRIKDVAMDMNSRRPEGGL